METNRHLRPGSVNVEFMCTDPHGKRPSRSRVTDVGYDIYSAKYTLLEPMANTIVHTSVRVACPPGFYMTIDGRSSMWSNGLVVNRGIIDSTYNGELLVSIFNSSDVEWEVMSGDRIAQLIIHKQIDIDWAEVSEFSPAYNIRGEAGFGSSGR